MCVSVCVCVWGVTTKLQRKFDIAAEGFQEGGGGGGGDLPGGKKKHQQTNKVTFN